MNINPFSIASLLLAIICFFIILLLAFHRKTKLQKYWLYFNVSNGLWCLGAFLITQVGDNEAQALHLWRMVEISVAFIAVFFLHVTAILCSLNIRVLLIFAYIQGIIFSILSLTSDLFFPSVKIVFDSFYYADAGILFYLFFFIWISLVIYAQIQLFITFFRSEGKQRNQLKYFILALLTGFTGGATNFFPHFGLNIYPLGNFTIIIYCIIVTYATFKHKLLDINILLTRTGIFIAVYSMVLGIPFAIAFGCRAQLQAIMGPNWWMGPLIISTALATIGPFIYFYIEKKAEERIFQEQRRYQNTLRQASSGMGRIKDLDRLVNLIVHIVTRTVRLEHALIYLNDPRERIYLLRSSRSQDVRFNPVSEVAEDSPIVKYLIDSKNPIVYDEIKQRTEDFGDLNLVRLESALKQLNAALVVPSFVEDRLLAIIVLGKKASGALYTEDDLNVFSILANQAALAIENAQFYEDMKLTHEQLFKAEKMATIGTMADGLSHQINNRLHALGFIASDVLDTIKLKKGLPMSPELKEVLIDIEHGLTRIQENVTQGGEIVRGLLKYTRKGEEGFAEVDLNQLLDSAVEMTQFKIKPGEMTILREFGSDTPKIKGNFTQLQEVFFNLIDNAYDAMMQRRNEFKEEKYEPTIKVSTTNSQDGHLIISVLDNGIGIKDDDKNKLFTPFFTTKLSSKKGTGLGLYVIRKLIEENHGGKVLYESKYREGTRVTLSLPIYSNS